MKEDLKLLRKGLWPLSMVYGLGVSLRNTLFDMGLKRVHRAAVPVVSVGNLAAGGTGKTPLVAWLVAQAQAGGLRPGVLARGYGRAPGDDLNDEGKLLARRFAGLPQVQDPDRVRGASRLVEEHGVDLIVMDDGFQHRRLHRDWDLCCLDMARPFAGGLLPVGYRREHPKALRRASAVVLTRAGGFTAEAIAQRQQQLAAYVRDGVPIYASDHVPARLIEMPGGRDVGLGALRDRQVMLLSGIARPESFAATVAELGGDVVGHEARPDHHCHTAVELADLAERAEARRVQIVTTEKDEVKLVDSAVSRWVLELELGFLGAAPEIGPDAATFLSKAGRIDP